MTKQAKAIPKFTSEAQERAFWETHDSAEYLDWGQARKVARLTMSQGVFVAEGTVIAGPGSESGAGPIRNPVVA